MPSGQGAKAPPLPAALIAAGSVAVIFHLSALVVLVIAAPSGPWLSPFGPSEAAEPEFIKGLNQAFGRYYLHRLHMTHNYHFLGNQPEMPQIQFEARVRDESGKLITTLKFPDPSANYWVRHRQTLLAQGLGNDQPYMPPQSVQAVKDLSKLDVTLWHGPPKGENKLQTKKEYEWQEIRSRGAPMFNRPSEWSQVLARSYARHLSREYGGAKVEIVRHSREPIPPEILLPRLQSEMVQLLEERSFTTLSCNFGDQSGGK